MKARPSLAISLIQIFLCLAHWFMYETWVSFWWPMSHGSLLALRIAIAVLSVAFLPASLLSFRFSNLAVRSFYRVTALWMGLANFLFVAALLAWLADLALRVVVPNEARLEYRPYIAGALLAISVATATWGPPMRVGTNPEIVLLTFA